MGGFYNQRAWRDRARKTALIKADWKCKVCGKPIRGRDAQVHHRFKLKDHPHLAMLPENHEALCRSHHSRETALEMWNDRRSIDPARMGCNADGWPLGPQHPWNLQA